MTSAPTAAVEEAGELGIELGAGPRPYSLDADAAGLEPLGAESDAIDVGGRSNRPSRAGPWRTCAVLLLPLAAYFVVFALWIPSAYRGGYASDGESVAVGSSGCLGPNAYAGPPPGAGAAELMVLMHVTDVHISRFNASQAAHFRSFCNEVVPAVQPRAVLATGDFVDGYADAARRGGAQQEVEWQEYRGTLEAAGLLSRPASEFLWLDTRGNHDAYGTGAIDDPQTNMFERYSVVNRAAPGVGQRVWRRDLELPGTSSSLRVVGLDAALAPGVSRPFQNLGMLDAAMRADIVRELDHDGGATGTLLVGHHPDSHIVGGLGAEVRARAPYYLTGHVHSATMKLRLGGSGMLELELADMKAKQAWRLMAFDHGQTSFRDQALHAGFPVGLVTNPKEARYLSVREPNHAFNSSHVRILAFSDVPIASVSVAFGDGSDPGAAPRQALAHPSARGLYLLPWAPLDQFSGRPGLHVARVTIVDEDGKTEAFDHTFSLDGTTESLGKSKAQARQAVGDNARFVSGLLALVTVANAVIVWALRGVLRARRRLRVYVLGSFLCLSLGPLLVGFFVTTDAPLTFVLPYGLWVVSQGFAADPVATLVAVFVQTAIVFPFLAFLTLHFRAFPPRPDNWADPEQVPAPGVGLKFSAKTLFARLRRRPLPGSALRSVVLPLWMTFLAVALPPFFLGKLFNHAAPLFLSPAMWCLAANEAIILHAIATAPAQGGQYVDVDGVDDNHHVESAAPAEMARSDSDASADEARQYQELLHLE